MRLHEDCVHISFRKEDFRVSFLAPFLVVFVSALLVCELFFIVTGNNSFQVLFLLVPGIVLVLCSSAILIIQGRYKFDIGPDGISCYNFWCRPIETSWDSIEDWRVVRTAGLSYLQVSVRNTKETIWIPLFVKRELTLRKMLATYTHNSRELYQKLNQIWP